MKKYLILILLSLVCFVSYSQDVLYMGVSGHQDITSNNCILYDDGGSTGNHSSRVDASYTIRADNPNYGFKITSKQNLSNNMDKTHLYVFDSENTSSSIVADLSYNWWTYDNYSFIYYIDSPTITVEFFADDDNPNEGFEIKIEAYDCSAPTNVQSQWIDPTTMLLQWDGDDVDYTINYVPGWNDYHQWTTTNMQTIHTNTNSVTISGLPPYTSMVYDIYRDDCSGVKGKGTLGYLCEGGIEPQNFTTTTDEDSVYVEWDAVEGATWYIGTNYYTLDDGIDYWGYVGEQTSNQISFPKYCNATDYVVAVIGSTNGYQPSCGSTYYRTYIGCPKAADYIWCKSISSHSITVWWNDINLDATTFNGFVVGYKKTNSMDAITYYDTLAKNVFECKIEGLEDATEYTFYVYTLCDDCGLSTAITCNYKTPLENCLDFTNLTSESTFLTWGDYTDPYWDTTMNNYQHGGENDSFWLTDRQVVNVDTNEYDSNTNNLLRVVPPGERASLRLGNSSIGAEAESISYEYFVDSSQYDMLVLKYAVVLQDPDHDKTNQPRFTLEILDENNKLIDSLCGSADFYAAGELGWNSVQNGNSTTLWKDWTTIGVDIAKYHNSTIRVRFTTYDCAEGGHFGYAYFHINCGKKRLYLVNRCDAQDSIHLVAPLGFEYIWQKNGSDEVLSTNYDITVPVDTNEYHCKASFVGKPECYFTISTVSINVEPHAFAEYVFDSCLSEVKLTNKSYVDYDTNYNVYINQMVDTFFWILEDGTTSPDSTQTRYYPENGTYDLKLICSLSNSKCADTLSIPINVNFNAATLVGPDTVCQKDNFTIYAKANEDYESSNISYLWNTGETTDSINITAMQSEDYSVSMMEDGYCRGLLKKHVTVNPSYFDTTIAEICQGETFVNQYFNVSQAGTYIEKRPNEYGCDSIITLYLTVNPTYNDTLYLVGCGEGYNDDNFLIEQSGIYTRTLQTIEGCDSIVTIVFKYVEPFVDSISAEIYKGDTFTMYGFNESTTGSYEMVYQDTNGCDSTYYLDLKVINFRFPNVVTPNGDGINDVFDITDVLEQTIFTNVTIRIYNRYGRTIFEVENPKTIADMWDPDATNTPTGTYFFRFTAKSQSKNIDFVGTIDVLR